MTSMKTNKDGRECAPWCKSEHDDPDRPWSTCNGPAHVVRAMPRGSINPPSEVGYARAYRFPGEYQRPGVTATLHNNKGYGSVTVFTNSGDDAERLARFLELAADAPAKTLRDLAERIREAAAEAYPEPPK